jgi:hypothetical protein
MKLTSFPPQANSTHDAILSLSPNGIVIGRLSIYWDLTVWERFEPEEDCLYSLFHEPPKDLFLLTSSMADHARLLIDLLLL